MPRKKDAVTKYDYRIRYTINATIGHYGKGDLQPDFGDCDAFALFSILKQGGYSQAVISMDGTTGNPMTGQDLFKLWVTLGEALAGDKSLDPFRKQFAADTVETFTARAAKFSEALKEYKAKKNEA